MALYAVIGTLTKVDGAMNWFMPGLAVGAFFAGTMTVKADPSNPKIFTAVLHINAGAHLVNATSIGLEPLKSFADHVPTGPLSSPTVQHGAIDNVFFDLVVNGASLGTTGFTVQGPGPDGSTKAGSATGTIKTVAAFS
jgi:hypothetical protein